MKEVGETAECRANSAVKHGLVLAVVVSKFGSICLVCSIARSPYRQA